MHVYMYMYMHVCMYVLGYDISTEKFVEKNDVKMKFLGKAG